MVARDQNVVALTLAAAGRRRTAGLASRRPSGHPAAQRPASAVLAVRRTRPAQTPTGSRCAAYPMVAAVRSRCTTHCRVGTAVTTSGPRNAFPLSVPGYGSPTRRLRFIAGGIGITPILPMLGLAERLGVDWSMIYVGRSARRAFRSSTRSGDSVGASTIRTDDVRRAADRRRSARRMPRRHNGVRVRTRRPAQLRPASPHWPRRCANCISNGSPPPPVIDGQTVHRDDRHPGCTRMSGPTRRCWRHCSAPVSIRRTRASRASAAPAVPGCSMARSSTATRC